MVELELTLIILIVSVIGTIASLYRLDYAMKQYKLTKKQYEITVKMLKESRKYWTKRLKEDRKRGRRT